MIELLNEYANKTQSELNAIIDTGAFNGIIEAYTVLTIKAMGYSKEEQRKAQTTLKEILDDTTSNEAIEQVKRG